MHWQLHHQCGLLAMREWGRYRYMLQLFIVSLTVKLSYINIIWVQRLAEDSNPIVAAAASKAIYELKQQWEIEEGDSWRFTMDLKASSDTEANDNNTDTN